MKQEPKGEYKIHVEGMPSMFFILLATLFVWFGGAEPNLKQAVVFYLTNEAGWIDE